ncbi:MAG: hypothetical protein ACPIOQ_31155 [Promethearchaeia archaeon]
MPRTKLVAQARVTRVGSMAMARPPLVRSNTFGGDCSASELVPGADLHASMQRQSDLMFLQRLKLLELKEAQRKVAMWDGSSNMRRDRGGFYRKPSGRLQAGAPGGTVLGAGRPPPDADDSEASGDSDVSPRHSPLQTSAGRAAPAAHTADRPERSAAKDGRPQQTPQPPQPPPHAGELAHERCGPSFAAEYLVSAPCTQWGSYVRSHYPRQFHEFVTNCKSSWVRRSAAKKVA